MTGNRKLAPNEQSMEILNRCASSFNVVTISRITGDLKEEIVTKALDLIQSRHPRLNSRIVGDLDNLSFEFGSKKIPLRVIQKLSFEQWQEVALEELNKPIESDKCLARAVLITFPEGQINYLLTILHHAISDGLSTVQLHSEILTYCQKIVDGEIKENIPSLHPLPDIQELMSKSMQGKIATVKGILFLLRFKLKISLYRPETLKFEKYLPTESRRCNMVQRRLNTEITAKLLEFCRQEKTTIQGSLCAAMMIAAARKIKSEPSAKIRLSCRSYVDLRKRLKPEVNRENLGILASSITSFHTLDTNTSFWDLARDVRQQLEVSLESEDIFNVVLMFKKICESLLSRPNEAPVTVGITNIGKIDIPSDYGLFKLEEISFVPAQAAFGGVFGAAVTTFQGTMILNFMFSEPSLSKETIEILADDAISFIVDNCNYSELQTNIKSQSYDQFSAVER
ncbi:condensation domain-containing protein [Anabaena cylindrica UHCC 0172]|uniref:phthiocerol/phthiodiolone dimycocerosyl transferase family protein n=1 Tax=Anabaena cylindrica TaxID=1165 RepID=UPI002B21F758|nr:condensation domain-containing protein [Anabaena cylindrica]MEA5551401.1 condensation domain-containing protein [Anabaena cylindrica UHCC 0172]